MHACGPGTIIIIIQPNISSESESESMRRCWKRWRHHPSSLVRLCWSEGRKRLDESDHHFCPQTWRLAGDGWGFSSNQHLLCWDFMSPKRTAESSLKAARTPQSAPDDYLDDGFLKVEPTDQKCWRVAGRHQVLHANARARCWMTGLHANT